MTKEGVYIVGLEICGEFRILSLTLEKYKAEFLKRYYEVDGMEHVHIRFYPLDTMSALGLNIKEESEGFINVALPDDIPIPMYLVNSITFEEI